MSLPVLDIHLQAPPEQRWAALREHRAAVRELVDIYVRDLGDIGSFRDELEMYRAACVAAEYQREIDAVAELSDVDPIELLLVNVYYDAFKHLMGCTAFAVDTPDGPVHARNLDWWTEHGALSRHSIIARFLRGDELVFEAVTWPGFLGTFSGVAPGRFSVTLNAALSDDAPGLAHPISLVLRDLLTKADFNTALQDLESRSLSCDCLLLVVGTRPGEMCVVERTPGRAALRRTDSGAIAVTNDYRLLDTPDVQVTGGNVLQHTSCARYARASGKAHSQQPTTADECFAILDDPKIKMDITVQQMAMSAAQGWLQARPGNKRHR